MDIPRVGNDGGSTGVALAERSTSVALIEYQGEGGGIDGQEGERTHRRHIAADVLGGRPCRKDRSRRPPRRNVNAAHWPGKGQVA